MTGETRMLKSFWKLEVQEVSLQRQNNSQMFLLNIASPDCLQQ